MEENQQEQKESTQEAPSFPQENQSGVSFPTVGAPKKSGGAKGLLIVGILILVGILGFVIYKSASSKVAGVLTEPTPFDNLTEPVQPTQTASPTPSSTPKAAEKSKVMIQVQNGTGITGEAAYLQTQLGGLGYTNIKVGNASSTNNTSTQVSFASALDSAIVAEITQKLKSIYQNVTTTSLGTTTFDVVIVTGLRKGATAKPSATPTANPSASSSGTTR